MREDTVVRLRQPGTFSEDPLTEVLRLGARRLRRPPKLGLELGYALGKIGDHRIAFLDHNTKER